MPYKIVKTFEKGHSKLSTVPTSWEKDGILHWPRYNENKLRRDENAQPENNWRKINCKVKRSNLTTFLEAEQEIDKMCKKSETDTDTEQYYSPKQNDTTKLKYDQLVQECIVLQNIGAVEIAENDQFYNLLTQSSAKNTHQQHVNQPDKDPNSEHTTLLVPVDPSATSSDTNNAQDNVPTQIQIDNTASFNFIILEKLETLQENYKSLDEKFQSIMLGLANISVQFERIFKHLNGAETNKRKTNVIQNLQTIESEPELNNFEKLLENPETEEELKKKFSIICGKGKGRGINNAYALVDSMFSRCFLLQCSWSGGSRTDEQKICFKSHTKIINFFFNIVHESDSSFSLLDCHKFFKNILKNSRQRNASKQERISRTKNRPKIKGMVKNLRNVTRPSLPITGNSVPENSTEAPLLAFGAPSSGSENRSEPVVEISGPDNDDDSMSSISPTTTHLLETFV